MAQQVPNRGAATSTEPSRRERKKDETRRRIVEAAIGLFREKGYAATTVDDISNRADVAKGTFFNYFPRKEAVLAVLADAETQQVEETTRRLLASRRSTRSKILDLVSWGAVPYEENRELSRVMILEMLTGSLAELLPIQDRAQVAIRQLIEQGQASRELRHDMDPDRVTGLIRGVFFSTILLWLCCPQNAFNLKHEIRARVSLVLDGLVV